MISIKLMGGLGNVMFQIATIEWLGKVFNKEVCYTNVDTWIEDLKTNYFWLNHAEDYLTLFPNLDLYKNHNQRFMVKRNCEVQFRYADCLPEDGDFFIGYFQSEQNFPDPLYVKNLFTPSETIKTKITESYSHFIHGITCSIHVRRRNYCNLQPLHPTLGFDYYLRAISEMKATGAERFLVFSDDLNWCKYNFIGDEFVFIDEIDYLSLFLMTRCKHHIISNSSFAWWGAWLGENEGSVVIAPQIWFGRYFPIDHEADIVSKRWIKL